MTSSHASLSDSPDPTVAAGAAERRLAELTDILERVTDAFFALDRDWRFTYMNGQAERLLQRPPRTLLGRSIWDEFPEAVGSTFWRQYHRAVREGASVTFTEFYPPLDGWFEVKAYPGADGLSVFFRDVTEQRRVQEELERSQARLGLALEAGHMGAWEWDIARDRVIWSPQEERLYGLEPGTFEGTVEAYHRRIHPDDVVPSWKLLEDALARRAETHHVVHRILRADGEVRWLDSHGRFVYGEDGRPLRLVGVSTDVTERRTMEEALRYQHYITETIANNATSALFMMDRDGHPTYMNPAATAITGFTLDEIKEFPLHYAIHHHHPDGTLYPMADCPVDRALPENFDVRAHEDVFIRKDGTFFPVLCAASPIFENDRPVGTVVEVRDVTEQRRREEALRRREEALRRSEERYRSLAEAIGQIVWTAMPDGQVDDIPQWRAYTGQTLEEVRGWGWLQAIHPDDQAPTAAAWSAAVASPGTDFNVEYRVRAADGTYRWFNARGAPVLNEDGTLREWVGVCISVDERRRAEEERDRALAEARFERERLNSVFQQAPALIALYSGAEHTITLVNPVWRQITGREDVLGRPFREVFPEFEGQGLFELLDRVYETGEPFVGKEFQVFFDRTGTGAPPTESFWNFVWHPLRDAAGRVTDVFVHGVEVTDQVLARWHVEALAAERAAILGQVAEGVITTDAEGRITFLNRAAAEIHGTAQLDVPPEGYTAAYGLARMDGTPFPAEELPLTRAVRGERVTEAQWRIRRPDGTEVIAEGSAAPVLSEDGRRIGAVLTLRDVTARQALQERIRAERNRLLEVFAQAPAAVFVTEGPQHLGTVVNDRYREVVGQHRELLGRPIREAFPDLIGQPFFDLLDAVYASGEPYAGTEVPARMDRDADGVPEEHFFNFVYQPLRDAEGNVFGIMTHAVEVTEQVLARREVERKAEELARLTEALERSNRELDQFAYVTSHDLKAPLRGIANLTQWIEEDLGELVTRESAEHMRLLKGRVHRMEALIDGILTYSRAARARAKPEPVDTGALVGEIVDLLAPPAGVVEVAPGMPVVHAERVPLQQVFMNLVSNALKHGRADAPKVRVAWREDGDAYEFTVADNGPGIAPEFHDRIWGIFQTLEARDRVEGTGIGLAVVKKIVESRGGRAWVESAPGAGATFKFTWPMAA